MAKPLSNKQIEEIYRLHDQGLIQKEIAKSMGITGPTVSRRLKDRPKTKTYTKRKQSKQKFMDIPLQPTGGDKVMILICKPSEVKELLGELWRQ